MAYIARHKLKEELQPVVAGGLGHYRDHSPDAKVLSVLPASGAPHVGRNAIEHAPPAHASPILLHPCRGDVD